MSTYYNKSNCNFKKKSSEQILIEMSILKECDSENNQPVTNLKWKFDNIVSSPSLLVSFRNIETVPFPAMTICAPNSRRWSSLAEALNQFDKDGLIYDVIRNYTKQVDDDNRISRVIENSKLYSYVDANAADWMYQFYPYTEGIISLPQACFTT